MLYTFIRRICIAAALFAPAILQASQAIPISKSSQNSDFDQTLNGFWKQFTEIKNGNDQRHKKEESLGELLSNIQQAIKNESRVHIEVAKALREAIVGYMTPKGARRAFQKNANGPKNKKKNQKQKAQQPETVVADDNQQPTEPIDNGTTRVQQPTKVLGKEQASDPDPRMLDNNSQSSSSSSSASAVAAPAQKPIAVQSVEQSSSSSSSSSAAAVPAQGPISATLDRALEFQRFNHWDVLIQRTKEDLNKRIFTHFEQDSKEIDQELQSSQEYRIPEQYEKEFITLRAALEKKLKHVPELQAQHQKNLQEQEQKIHQDRLHAQQQVSSASATHTAAAPARGPATAVQPVEQSSSSSSSSSAAATPTQEAMDAAQAEKARLAVRDSATLKQALEQAIEVTSNPQQEVSVNFGVPTDSMADAATSSQISPRQITPTPPNSPMAKPQIAPKNLPPIDLQHFKGAEKPWFLRRNSIATIITLLVVTGAVGYYYRHKIAQAIPARFYLLLKKWGLFFHGWNRL